MIMGIDHGYYAIKTRHFSFPAGVTAYTHEPYTLKNTLQIGGKYYVCGTGRQPILRDKTVNDNYYILTLAAIAMELRCRGLPAESSVTLAAGLPLARYGRDKKLFTEYLLRNGQPVSFLFEGERYKVKIENVKLFPQGYSAIAIHPELVKDEPSVLLMDIGGWAVDRMRLDNNVPTLLSGHLMPADIVDLNDYKVESWPSTPEGEERQRREWREMYEILFSHPQVEAITGWDFADGAWLNAPSGLLRADNSPKPSYRELQRLIHEAWTSQGELHTDENGVAVLAGFRETYSLHSDRAQAEVQLTAQPITQPRRILLQDCHT